MKRKFWDENTMTNWMNEGEIKSELHATKHGQVKILLFNNNNINNWFIKN